MGIPDLESANPLYGPSTDEQVEAALNLAGLAQTGALPFAPVTGKGTVGSIGSLNSQLGKTGAKRAEQRIIAPEEGVRIGQRVSTANPTDKVAEEIGFHDTPQYILTPQMMREDPEKFAANMELMSKYFPTNKRNPEARYEDYVNHMRGNLEFLVNNMPKDFLDRSTNWYKGANALANDISNAYDVPIEASAGVLARLSPGMDWLQNVEQADRFVDIWRNHQNTIMPEGKYKGTRLSDMPNSSLKADWIRSFDEATTPGHFYGLTPEGALTQIQRTLKGEPKSLMWQTNANLLRAVNMLEDPSINNISRNLGTSGHKIRNFYNNIVDPFHPSDTTIDTHAVSSSILLPYSQKGIPVGHAFGGGAIPGVVRGSSKSGMASGTYGAYLDAYQQAARNLELNPQEVQSPTWEIIKEIFPTAGHQKDKLREEIETRVMSDLKKKLITPDQARQAIVEIATKNKGFSFPEWYR